MRIGLLVPAGFAAGAIASKLLLAHAPAAVHTDLAQPLAVVTYWHGFGARLWLVLFGSTLISGIGYCAVMRYASIALAPTMALCALSCACALAFPIVFSSDVYAYAGYGAMARSGIDPYAHARIAVRDPLFDAVLWQWGNPPPVCVYGPAFVWLAEAIVALCAHAGASPTLWAFRVLACCTLIGCAPLAYAAFARFSPACALPAAAGIALNPVAIWSCAEGHNDVLVLALALIGFVFISRARPFAGALVVALAALVKAPALLAAAGVVLSSWRSKARFHIMAGAIVGTGLAVAVAVPLEGGFRDHLMREGHYAPQFSLLYATALVLPEPPAILVLLLACGAFMLAGLRRLSRGDASGAAQAALALWLAIPNPYPWYGLWLLPLAFLPNVAQTGWRSAIVAASLLAIFRYYGDATSELSVPLSLAIVFLQCALPIALLMVARRNRAHRDLREIHRAAPDFALPRSS